MGYNTQNLIASSQLFQDKVQMALTNLVNSALGGANDAMAKVVMHDIRRYSMDLANLLAIDGLDLDSTDSALDTALTSNIKWLIAKTGK